jgi:hypothetical protein
MQEVEVRQSSGGSSTTTISLTTPAATRGSRGSSGRDSSELDPTATSSVTSGGSEEAPMDLSSGGGGHGGMHGGVAMPVTPTTLLHNASLARFEDHPLLNARKLAEFVKAQHLVQQQRANETTPPSVADSLHCDMQMRMHPKKRPWPSTPLSLASEKEVSAAAEVVRQKSLIPLDLIRAKFELHGGERSSPDSAEGGSSSNASTPSLNSNPVVGSNNNNGAMNGNGSSSGREVKKRRLDELLSKKFAMADSPPSASNSPSPKPVVLQSVGSPVFHHEGKGGSSRRKSSEHQPRKANRRKQPHPQSPPTGLTIRPSADLFPQQRPITPPPPPAARPLKPLAIPKSEVDNEALKGQILQLQLAQAALLSNPSDLLKSALGGASAAGQQPMLIYGYYAQILQSIQSQQHKLVEELASKQRSSPTVATSSPRLTDNFKFPPTAESILREPSRNPVSHQKCWAYKKKTLQTQL